MCFLSLGGGIELPCSIGEWAVAIRMLERDVGVRWRRLQRVKGRSEWRKREEAKSGDYDVRRASWRQSWVLPEADSPTTSVTEAVGRPLERRRSRTWQPRESLAACEEGRGINEFSVQNSSWCKRKRRCWW
jgi:hypothetical protein